MLNNAYFCFMNIKQIIKSIAASPVGDQIKTVDGLKHISARKLTLKQCLPELPPKTFYTWVDEGLIPIHFGKDILSELPTTEKASNVYKGWNRFTVYEFFWVRLVYHLRESGYPKENIKKNATEFFSEKNPELLEAILKKITENEGEFQKLADSLAQSIGERSAQHEFEKILHFIIESTAFTKFHYEVIEALQTFRLPYFVATQDGTISSKASEELSDAKTTGYGSFLAIPYSIIINDLVVTAEPGYLANILGSDERTGMVIQNWKSLIPPSKHLSDSLELAQSQNVGLKTATTVMEVIYKFCDQIAALKA